VDDAGAVHRHGRHDAALHQVDDERAEADLDRMGAHAEDDQASLAMARRDGVRHRAQIARAEDVGQVEEALTACRAGGRPCAAATLLRAGGRIVRTVRGRDCRGRWSRASATVAAPLLRRPVSRQRDLASSQSADDDVRLLDAGVSLLASTQSR
jgi:hypothetical protein